MKKTHSNIVLIGMPGSGKSTVGVILAKKTSLSFVDVDILIQTSQKRTLQDIMDSHGCAVLRKIEEDVIVGLSMKNHVIATGGSAVYSHQAMTHLKSDGILIFLDVELATLESRIGDCSTRGIAKQPNQSFAELFDERLGLYTKYADISIKCDVMSQEQVCEKIIEQMEQVMG
ncbi:MAG: shikimate kinase [Thermodesulfobacteriota bacterium]|nr:shikimate kinase [Thermodesulfobacteriota bacterium]